MRKFTRGGLLAYGLMLFALAALAVAGAASGNHTVTADSHQVVDGNPELCGSISGGYSFRVDGGQLKEGGEYPADNPLVKITGLNVEGGTLSWALLPAAKDLYDVAAVVMKGGEPGAVVYYYDAGKGGL